MALRAGTRLGPYEILAPLGAGGMGEVYRARDTKLNREIALKVLPALLASDPDRLARFKREAQLLAALNHPNIAAIHGLEDADGTPALVLELVEGPTLADRVAEGPLPRDEALAIARQIADALEAAHERGIIHRDLKPANVKLRDDGTVKVLDFGLAKALENESRVLDASMSPTMSVAATGAGMILGTAAYMAPEQARGKAVDKRADVWAFGCVLFEMLTGRRAFDGEDATDIIATVVKSDPPWALLPSTVPPILRYLLERCLAKDPKRRLRDIADFRVLLDAPPPAELAIRVDMSRQRTRRRIIGVAAAASAAALTGLAVWAVRVEPPRAVRRFAITLPATDRFSAINRHLIALSPDGTSFVYVANQRLYLRRMDRLDAEPIRGTEGGPSDHARNPFYSPDGQWIGFWQAGQLKKVAVTGGAPVTLCKAENPTGASWAPGDVIVYGQGPDGIWQVRGSGGQPSALIRLDAAKGDTTVHGPHLLPGGEAVLFTLRSGTGTSWNDAQIVVQRLDTGERRVVVEGGTDGRYLPTGHLVYAREGALLAVPFDVERLVATGGPVPVLEDILDTISFGGVGAGLGVVGAAQFSTSLDGLLAYVPRRVAVTRTLVWVDRQGREEVVAGAPDRAYVYPVISPDGARVALDLRDQERDIWVWDFARATLTRVTADPAADIGPRWTPDGRRIVFSSDRGGQLNLFWQAADGTGAAEQLSKSPNFEAPADFSPDGAHLFIHIQEPSGEYDLGVLSLQGERRSQLLTDTDGFNEHNAAVSPDGAWIAYQSNESGRSEVYLSPFPRFTSARHLISTGGGTRPAWARSGRELFYLTESGTLMAVPIQTTPALTVGKPAALFEGPYFRSLNGRTYDVSPDGQRFLMIKEADATAGAVPQIVLVENWLDELTRLVPVP
ncbi:MAG: serine/threonine-protein kinase [Acidobacteria bacterium]|nr:serine/threonine-protein kinase [Acidobacteriota bacterium]